MTRKAKFPGSYIKEALRMNIGDINRCLNPFDGESEDRPDRASLNISSLGCPEGKVIGRETLYSTRVAENL
jgi:hypothetical protein